MGDQGIANNDVALVNLGLHQAETDASGAIPKTTSVMQAAARFLASAVRLPSELMWRLHTTRRTVSHARRVYDVVRRQGIADVVAITRGAATVVASCRATSAGE